MSLVCIMRCFLLLFAIVHCRLILAQHFNQGPTIREFIHEKIRVILNARYNNQELYVNAVYDHLKKNNALEKYCIPYYENNSLALERAIINEAVVFENILKNEISWIYTELYNILRQRCNKDNSAKQALNYFRTKKIGEQLHQSQPITANNVYSKLLPHIEDYEKILAVDFIRNQLLKMFPQLDYSLVISISEFIENQRIGANDIYRMYSKPQDFIYYFNLNQFVSTFNNRIQIEQAIDKEVNFLLMQEFEQNSASTEVVLKKFKQSNPSYADLWLLFESNKLAQLLRPFIENFWLSNALDYWFPSDKAFNKIFMNFIISQGISAATANHLSLSKQNFLQITYFERFAHDQYNTYKERVYEKVKVILNQKYKRDSSKVEIAMNYLRNVGFEQNFTPQMLYNFSLISKSVEVEIIKMEYRHCLDKVNNKKTNFPYLENNMCIANEICSQKRDIEDGFFDAEFQKYSPDRNNDKFDVTSNIKDEIDETIYDVIRNVLIDKATKKSDCIADYIRRNDKMNSKYRPELIFNETELWLLIEPIINEYHQMFNTS